MPFMFGMFQSSRIISGMWARQAASAVTPSSASAVVEAEILKMRQATLRMTRLSSTTRQDFMAHWSYAASCAAKSEAESLGPEGKRSLKASARGDLHAALAGGQRQPGVERRATACASGRAGCRGRRVAPELASPRTAFSTSSSTRACGLVARSVNDGARRIGAGRRPSTVPPRGRQSAREQRRVHQELRPILGPVHMRRRPSRAVILLPANSPPTSRPTSPRSSSAPAEPGGAEGDAHELQPGQRLRGAGGHDLQRVGPHGGVALVLQDFQAVDHRTQRAHKVVTDAADQKCRKIEVVHRRAHLGSMVSGW